MPGDVAIGDPEGVTFVPAHLAQKVADDAEMDRLVDEWGHSMLREGKYTPGQIDSKWTPDMIQAFNKWAETKGSRLRAAREVGCTSEQARAPGLRRVGPGRSCRLCAEHLHQAVRDDFVFARLQHERIHGQADFGGLEHDGRF